MPTSAPLATSSYTPVVEVSTLISSILVLIAVACSVPTHWGFFHEEPLPASWERQRQLLSEPLPPEALAKLHPEAAALIAATLPQQLTANWSYDMSRCLALPRVVWP